MVINNLEIKEFEIDLTGNCNLNCPICTRNYKHADHLLKKNIRPLKNIIQQLDYFPNLTRIMLAGAVSEPTLYPEFFKLIEYLDSRGIYIDLFTNGDTHNTLWWEKLGEIFEGLSNKNSSCTFTICGSTQELHSKYRINSNLDKTLNNIKSFGYSGKSRSILQIIRFEYNKNDINNILKFKNLFNDYYIVDSEGRRRLTDFKNNFYLGKDDITPLEKRRLKIDKIFKVINNFKDTNKKNIHCKSLKYKKLHIDQFGNIFPCYMLMEFPESKDYYFYTEEDIIKASVENTNLIFNFKEVFDNNFKECNLCHKNIERYIKKNNLDFVC